MDPLRTQLASASGPALGARATATPGHLLVPLAAAGVLALPGVSGGAALLAGVALALTVGNPYAAFTRRATHALLAASVVGLGAAMDLRVVARVGASGVGYTVVGIAVALLLGRWLGRALGVPREVALLITVGTAICGGSAIAAVAPAIRARDHAVSVALATVFVLNAVALFAFPWVGTHAGLGPRAFGLWCALAIHDTSSVVGAAATHGARALEVATTVKLARALWIVPVAATLGALHARRAPQAAGRAAPRRPWFIAGFLAMAALVTWVPSLRPAGVLVSHAAHRTLALTLFLTGCGLTRAAVRGVGARPFVQGAALWVAMAAGTLGAIGAGWVR